MEIFTELGVASEVLARSTPAENMQATAWYAGVNGPHDGYGRRLGRLEVWGGGYTDPDFIAASPCRTANLPQIRLEPVLKAHAERFPEADEVIVAWPDEALARMPVDRSTAVVILTHDPKFDMPALRAVLGKGAGYIGAIGSSKTNANRFDALREEGFSEADLATVHGPIGLDLGGRGAEETALGIMAEITAARHGGSGRFMRELKGDSSPPRGEVAGVAGRRGSPV